MSKIQVKVLDQHSKEEERISWTSRNRAPEASMLKSGKSNSKLRVIRAITESILVGDERKQISEDNDGSFWAKHLQFIFYKVLLLALYVLFGVFRYFQYQYNKMRLRVLGIVYNSTTTPQLIRQDVLKLSKIPKRLAAILEMKPAGEVGGGIKGLQNDASELVFWTVSAGVKHLMLYDFDGILKKDVDGFRKNITEKLTMYYGPTNVPKFAIRIPHLNKVVYNSDEDKKVVIEISLLSSRDGKETIVDLTKIMSELCASDELKLSDISMNLVDTELTQLVGNEPDLLLYFGPTLDLQGFPPWHIRLTEFYWEEDNDQVSYVVFIRGLQKYSDCKVNVGR